MENVAIIGASARKSRYSFKAQEMLTDHNHRVFPVNPYGGEVLGVTCYTSITEISERLDTVTIYISAKRLESIIDDIISKSPKRVIFNPGTECESCIQKVKEAGIEAISACTLVMLSTNQF